jgi:hypothetical protein
MGLFHESMSEFKKQTEKGAVIEAYRGFMEYILDLRTYFQNKYPDHSVSGSIYQGYMDMTFFSLSPESFKRRKLKIAIVFIYETFRFEVWLTGYNRQVQKQYWELFTQSNWDKYHVTSIGKGIDSIIDHILVDNPDFSDLDTLTQQIETGTLSFIMDIEGFLSIH